MLAPCSPHFDLKSTAARPGTSNLVQPQMVGIPIAWYKARIPGFLRKSRREGPSRAGPKNVFCSRATQISRLDFWRNPVIRALYQAIGIPSKWRFKRWGFKRWCRMRLCLTGMSSSSLAPSLCACHPSTWDIRSVKPYCAGGSKLSS